jgi:hypothetical protein
MSKPVRFAAAAEEELAAAVAWYERRRTGLGAEFFDAVDAAVQFVGERSEECAIVPHEGRKVRRKLVSRFPYALIFVDLGKHLRVIAVAHTARRPGYWRNRSD